MKGRPLGQMTARRQQVLQFVEKRQCQNRSATLGELVRECGLYDRTAAKRILRDLMRMGIISGFNNYSPR